MEECDLKLAKLPSICARQSAGPQKRKLRSGKGGARGRRSAPAHVCKPRSTHSSVQHKSEPSLFSNSPIARIPSLELPVQAVHSPKRAHQVVVVHEKDKAGVLPGTSCHAKTRHRNEQHLAVARHSFKLIKGHLTWAGAPNLNPEPEARNPGGLNEYPIIVGYNGTLL